MNKKPVAAKRTTTPIAKIKAKAKPDGLAPLIGEVRDLIQSARLGVASVVDTLQVMTNFEIGRRIVMHEQKGEKRAAYGAEVLKELSARLTHEFGSGFSAVNLSLMRRFYLTWQERVHIFQTPSEKLANENILQTLTEKSGPKPARISKTSSRKSPFTLSWSQYVELLGIKDPDERNFYEIESTNEGWPLSELRRHQATPFSWHFATLKKDGFTLSEPQRGATIQPRATPWEPCRPSTEPCRGDLKPIDLAALTGLSDCTTMNPWRCPGLNWSAPLGLSISCSAYVGRKETTLTRSIDLLKAKLLEWTSDEARA